MKYIKKIDGLKESSSEENLDILYEQIFNIKKENEEIKSYLNSIEFMNTNVENNSNLEQNTNIEKVELENYVERSNEQKRDIPIEFLSSKMDDSNFGNLTKEEISKKTGKSIREVDLILKMKGRGKS
ncbi:hypothetical protein WG909_00745 [Peptostreptococcaceae bacterium AGR-M142]